MTIQAFRTTRRVTPATVTAAASVAVAILAFWMSFTALSDLAARYGVPEYQAFALPLVVDGLVVVATVAAAALDRARWYAWTLLLASNTVSVAGNAVHAHTASGSPVAVAIAVVPPVCLLAVTHLTIMLVRQEWGTRESMGDALEVILDQAPAAEPASRRPARRPAAVG